jgi:hypothetical protein
MHLITRNESVAAYLAAIAATHGISFPAVAAVGAVLVSKLVFDNLRGAICAEWRKQLAEP